MNVQDPLFTFEHTTLDKLVAGLAEPCGCWKTKWVASLQLKIARIFMYFYSHNM